MLQYFINFKNILKKYMDEGKKGYQKILEREREKEKKVCLFGCVYMRRGLNILKIEMKESVRNSTQSVVTVD